MLDILTRMETGTFLFNIPLATAHKQLQMYIPRQKPR